MPRAAHSLHTAIENFLAAWAKSPARKVDDPRLIATITGLKSSLTKTKAQHALAVAQASVSPNVGRPQKVDRAEVLRLWQVPHEMSQAAIGRELGCSQNGIRLILLDLGNGQLPPRQ